MFENTPSDRVQLVGLGELLSPAKCMICGNGTCDEGYVKLGVFYDFEGEQYLCRNCVIQIAELFGCLTPEEAQHLQEQAATLATENAKLWEEVNDVRPVMDTLSKLFGVRAYFPDGSGDITTASESEGEPVTTKVDANDSGRTDEAESEPTESVKEPESSGTGESTASNRSSATINL